MTDVPAFASAAQLTHLRAGGRLPSNYPLQQPIDADLAAIRKRVADPERASFKALQQALAFVQKHRLRLPILVTDVGAALLQRFRSRLGDGVWKMYEDVCSAALDCHNEGVANTCLSALKSRFPDSLRVRRLEGMLLEARGDYETAEMVYDEILEKDPVHSATWKRKVALLRARGQQEDTIKELCAYLKVFAVDSGAWLELADLYMATGALELASYCYEELVLLEPHNYAHHLMYAEVTYTLGDAALAKQYYIQSLELKPDSNVRALFGLCLCLRSKKSGSAESSAQLMDWAAQQLVEHYEHAKSPMLDVVRATLE